MPTIMQLKNPSKQVEAAIKAANDHALMLGRTYVGAEDLFFGLMYSQPGDYPTRVADIIQKGFGVNRIDFHEATKMISARPIANLAKDLVLIDAIQFTNGVERALRRAEREASGGQLTRFDVVIGLIASRDAILYHILKELDIDPVQLEAFMRNPLSLP